MLVVLDNDRCPLRSLQSGEPVAHDGRESLWLSLEGEVGAVVEVDELGMGEEGTRI